MPILSGRCNFEVALDHFKNHEKIFRSFWHENNKEMKKIHPCFDGLLFISCFNAPNNSCTIHGNYESGKVLKYTPNVDDLFAEDWGIYDS